MNSKRSFHGLMQRLAAVAVLLMLVAPLISRWQQSHDLPFINDPVLCHSEEQNPSLAIYAAHTHKEKTPTHSSSDNRLTDHNWHEDKDHHDDHGIACDYCVLIARLLPLLIGLWLFPALLCAIAPNLRLARTAPQAAYWPAPNPRGPPLYS